METISRFLVYGLLDPCTGELRYVGKSARGMLRPKEHFKPNARIGHTHIAHWLAKLWRDSAQLPSILILKECASDLGIDYPSMRKYAIGKRTPHKLALAELERRMNDLSSNG